jgi:hypothetical protein
VTTKKVRVDHNISTHGTFHEDGHEFERDSNPPGRVGQKKETKTTGQMILENESKRINNDTMICLWLLESHQTASCSWNYHLAKQENKTTETKQTTRKPSEPAKCSSLDSVTSLKSSTITHPCRMLSTCAAAALKTINKNNNE